MTRCKLHRDIVTLCIEKRIRKETKRKKRKKKMLKGIHIASRKFYSSDILRTYLERKREKKNTTTRWAHCSSCLTGTGPK